MTAILEKNSGLDKIASTNVRRNYALVAKTVKKLKKPVEITVNGRADLIIMDPEIFEGLMNLIEEYQDELAVARFENRKDTTEFVSASEFFGNASLGEFEDMSIDELLNQ
jgi:PHD/YefM family antitoxin component YafN of YafNO toxin-antitoxin module